MALVLELMQMDAVALTIIIVCGFLSAVLHGATGMAGGIVMTAILSLMIGVKAAIPAMTVALIISHSSRVILNYSSIDLHLVKRVLIYAVPGIIVGSILFAEFDETTVAVIMATFLAASFPLKRYFRQQPIAIGNRSLALGSGAWGILAGNVVGPGFVLAPFLLATGMSRHTFVASLAVLVLIMNVTKALVFSSISLLNSHLFAIGLAIGLATIPGNYVGRAILRRMSDSDHSRLIDLMTLLVIANFLYIAARQTHDFF